MKIAQIQMHVSADKAENIRHACELVRSAGDIDLARYVHFDVRASRRSRKQIQPISSEKIEICLVRFKSISSREHIHYFRKPA